MTRLLRVISGSDQSPTIDYTDDVEWTDVQLAMMAADGQSGVGRIPIFDDGGLLPDGQLNRYLNTHNVVTVDDGPYRLFRGRIEKRETGRGKRRGKRVRKISVTTSDYNADLRGIVVNDFVRASESNIVRFQAVATTYLSGSPRVTTNLAQTYISSSNALNLAAKTYTGMYVGDVLADIAKEAGKTFFVTVDGQLFFDGSESTAYASSLRISDDPADANATTYAPIWDGEVSAAVEDGTEFATNLRTYYGSETSVTSSNTLAVYNDYWELLNWDSLATIASNAQIRSDARLQELAQDAQTITCTIGPIPWAQLGSIKCGQTIQIKARGAVGGRTPGGTFYGDSFKTVRIAELTWKFPAPELNFAVLRLVKPPKISAAGPGNQGLVVANEANNLAAGTLAALSVGSDNPTTLYHRDDFNGVIGTWGTSANFAARSGVDWSTFTSSACRASPPDGMWTGEAIYNAAIQTNSALPADAGYIGLELTVTLRGDTHSAGAHGGINGEESLVKGPHLVTVYFGQSAPSAAGFAGGAQLATVYQNATDKTVVLHIPSVGWGQHCTVYFQPIFRLNWGSICESDVSAWPPTSHDGGDGSLAIGNEDLKALTATGPGWVTAGAIGTRNGINTAFTLVGGYSAISDVWRNGVNLPLSSITATTSPNISTVGWAPISTDTFLVRYYMP